MATFNIIEATTECPECKDSADFVTSGEHFLEYFCSHCNTKVFLVSDEIEG